MKHIFLILLLALAVLACRKEERAAMTADAAPTTDTIASAPAATQAARVPQPTRMIVRNATLSIIVRDAAGVLAQVTTVVERSGGYVAEAKQWKERDQLRAQASLRVPSAQLQATLAAIRALAVRTESETMNAQDVTEEYTDLGSQLRNLQATEAELRELLQTVRRRTQKASEVMEIFNELTKVRGDIERIQGRLQYLGQMTAMSTIHVDLIPDVLAQPVVEPGWQPLATVKAASRALVNALKSVATALIWLLLYLVPLALVCIALALLIRPLVLRLRRRAA